jgi:tRNA threonylcarbamoyladenosine biosynthesis protein TsaB
MSLCVIRNDEVVSSRVDDDDEKRSEKLWVEIGRLLCGAGLTVQEIGLFAVCIGPGRFTGLRVGLAAAKGFATAARKPIIGITSLEAAATTTDKSVPSVVALVNAYKGEVYSQLFSIDSEGGPVAENEPLVSTLRSALNRVREIEGLVLVGDAALANEEEIRGLNAEMRREGTHELSRSWAIQHSETSSAEALARLALMKYLKGEEGTPEHITACYVRLAEAEIKLAKGLLGSKIERVRCKQ